MFRRTDPTSSDNARIAMEAAGARASVALPISRLGTLAESTAQEDAKGVVFDGSRDGTLKDFFKPRAGFSGASNSRGDRAMGEAWGYYDKLIEIAQAENPPVGDVIKKLGLERVNYTGRQARDHMVQQSAANTQNYKLFYGTTKPFLEAVAHELPKLNPAQRREALVKIKEGLGQCEGAQQDTFAGVYNFIQQTKGDLGTQLQHAREIALDKIVDRFIKKKEVLLDGIPLRPNNPSTAYARTAYEVHFKPALARELGVAADHGLQAGAATSDQYARRITFHAADLRGARAEYDAATLGNNLLSLIANDVCAGAGELICASLAAKAGESALSINQMFRTAHAHGDLSAHGYGDLEDFVTRSVGADCIQHVMSVNDEGKMVFSRNSGPMQRQLLQNLITTGKSPFDIDPKPHTVARTSAFIVERLGPTVTARDIDATTGKPEADFRAFELCDFAALMVEKRPRASQSTWASMAPHEQEILGNWVTQQNKPSMTEEMAKILERPGLIDNAVNSHGGPDTGRIFLRDAIRTLGTQIHDEIRTGDKRALPLMASSYLETKFRLPPPEAEKFGRLLVEHGHANLLGKIMARTTTFGNDTTNQTTLSVGSLLQKLMVDGTLTNDQLAAIGQEFMAKEREASQAKPPDRERLDALTKTVSDVLRKAESALVDGKVGAHTISTLVKGFPVHLAPKERKDIAQTIAQPPFSNSPEFRDLAQELKPHRDAPSVPRVPVQPIPTDPSANLLRRRPAPAGEGFDMPREPSPDLARRQSTMLREFIATRPARATGPQPQTRPLVPGVPPEPPSQMVHRPAIRRRELNAAEPARAAGPQPLARGLVVPHPPRAGTENPAALRDPVTLPPPRPRPAVPARPGGALPHPVPPRR